MGQCQKALLCEMRNYSVTKVETSQKKLISDFFEIFRFETHNYLILRIFKKRN